MNDTPLNCRDERRRAKARERNLNGIDYVSVGPKQKTLCVHLFGDVPEYINESNVVIKGGRRVRDIQVISAKPATEDDDPELGECLHVELDKYGDFSTYTLCLVESENGRPTDKPLKDFDPRYSCVDFSFKVDCPSDLDCKTEETCPPEPESATEINYLAKDYSSFRQLMLDRLALVMPDWRERHIPDIGITLVELMAYVGDYLSYYQDAVATEAYLDTARLRISVRRHARLVDYQMHEGCNSRAFLFIETDGDYKLDPKNAYFITGSRELERAPSNALTAEAFKQFNIPASHYDVFEPLVEKGVRSIQLYRAHSEIRFYTWGDAECCLARGATRATLTDAWVQEEPPPGYDPNPDYEQYEKAYPKPPKDERPKPPTEDTPPGERKRELHLAVGDLLIFEEVLGAKTGNEADRDPSHRHAVRLTKVEPGVDIIDDQPVVEIEWAEEDALPFPLCISAVLPAPDCKLKENISVARGNVILVDHGRTIYPPEPLGQVPLKTTTGECECGSVEMTKVPGKFQPVLREAPLTFSQPLDASLSASATLVQDAHLALPQIIRLTGLPGVCTELSEAEQESARAALPEDINPNNSRWQWQARGDLLGSQSTDRHFVAEMDDEGHAHLRFGDGDLGRMPEACMSFEAMYRVGQGRAGNVGADTITYLIFRNNESSGVRLQPRNPLPARGGTEPEPVAEVKLKAAGAIRKQLQRAITADDYARLAERSNRLQRAAGELRWTGSWYEARVAVDPRGTEEVAEELLKSIEGQLYPYRRMGHDLSVAPASYVPLEIKLEVCVEPHYQAGHVEAALMDAFSTHALPGGKRGFFHPDNLTFGGGIHLSQLVATAQAVEGVRSVTVSVLQRSFNEPSGEIESGVLPLGTMEIARLDRDPSFPEHGKLTFKMTGGR
ncbi:MAG: putative baseplate assembly protein [Pyrinomonadaceae bacterium]|nr:putative baseplate assembly protein [Pyrinomonadaceae bacterium]